MTKKQLNWLSKEISSWNSEGLISSETAAELSRRYTKLYNERTSVGVIILGSLGALLTGLGIISLLAANWGDIPRNGRVVIAFVPLFISYCALIRQYLKFGASLSYIEPLGIFWGLAIGAGIALISQIYHLPGDMDAFLLTWMILLLPVVWLTRSLGGVVGYFVGLLFWCGYVESVSGTAIMYWPLAALAMPVIIREKQREPTGMRTVFMFWSFLISSIIALGITLDKAVPGLWIIIYVALFSVLLLSGNLFEQNDDDWRNRPLTLCGACGLAIVLHMLCYKWPWSDVGPTHLRHGFGYYLWVSIIYDFALAIALCLLSLILFLLWRRRAWLSELYEPLRKTMECAWFSAPLVVLAAYGLASYAEVDVETICAIILTIYLALCAMLTIAVGVTARILWMMNCGMLLFLSLVIGKFFSEEYSHTVKGVVFIVCGAIFFISNQLYLRHLRKEGRCE